MMYLLLTNIYLILFYTIYRLFLKELTFFQWNRIYLLSSLGLSLLLPGVIYLDLSYFNPTHFFSIQSISTLEELPLPWNLQVSHSISFQFHWIELYFFSCLLAFIMLIARFIRLYFRLKKAKFSYSFFGKIYVDEQLEEKEWIRKHEHIHRIQGHSWDILAVELIRVFLWFNPILIVYKRSLKMQHEFFVDDYCSRQNKVAYAELLLSNALEVPNSTLFNEFSNPSLLKTRIMFLFKNRSAKTNQLKYAFLFCLAIPMSVAAMAFNDMHIKQNQEVNAVLALEDKIDTPPIPKAGMSDFMSFIGQHYNYSEELKKNKVTGIIEVSFVVNKDGKLSDYQVLKDLGYRSGQELIRVLKQYPDWTPGFHEGHQVAVKYVLPVRLNQID